LIAAAETAFVPRVFHYRAILVTFISFLRLSSSNRVTRGIPSDLQSLNSVNTLNTSGGASVMGMFSTSALYHDPLLDNPLYGSSAAAGGASGSGSGSGGPLRGARGGVSGQKAAVAGGARRDNFDTASLRSQDDTAR